MAYVVLSKKDLTNKFQSALTKMQRAREEVSYLCDGGYGDAELAVVVEELDQAIEWFLRGREVAVEKYGFTIREGL